MPRIRHAGLALAQFCLACGPARGVRIDSRSRSFDRLTSADLARVTVQTLEEAIVELRPAFLRTNLRGERLTVFVNGIMASLPSVCGISSSRRWQRCDSFAVWMRRSGTALFIRARSSR